MSKTESNKPRLNVNRAWTMFLLGGMKDRELLRALNEIQNEDPEYIFEPIKKINFGCITFLYVPSGKFVMGDKHDGDSCPPMERRVSHFYMAETPVTVKQWNDICMSDPDLRKYIKPASEGDINTSYHPVASITPSMMAEVIERMSALSGYRFRLPTEVEWEYACRAGTTTKYYFGDEIDQEKAIYRINRLSSTIVYVKSRPPNPWGFYDMAGTIWEVCCTKYRKYPDEDYSDMPLSMEAIKHAGLVARGGSFSSSSIWLKSASRLPALAINNSFSTEGSQFIGFRIVCELP